MPHPCIIPWNDTAIRRHDRGWSLPFVDERCGAHQLRMHVSSTNPGLMPHPPHQHDGEEIIFLLEGTAEVLHGTAKHVAGPNTAIFFPSQVLHGLRNIGDGPMKYIVIKVPDPASAEPRRNPSAGTMSR